MYNYVLDKVFNRVLVMSDNAKVGEISIEVDNNDVYAEIVELPELENMDQYFSLLKNVEENIKSSLDDSLLKIIWESPRLIKDLDKYAEERDNNKVKVRR